MVFQGKKHRHRRHDRRHDRTYQMDSRFGSMLRTTCSPEKVIMADHVAVKGQSEGSLPSVSQAVEAMKLIEVVPARV